MTPDLFRPLDRIDPPDQWDVVAARATEPDRVDLLAPDRPRRARRAALVGAAAALVLLGGAVVRAAGDSDGSVTVDDEAVAAATDEPTPAGVQGPCPFTLGDGIGPVSPFDGASRPAALPVERTSTGIVVVDDLEVVVSLGGSALLDGPVAPAETVHRAQAIDTGAGTITVSASRAVATEGPCPDAEVVTVLPLLPEHADAVDLRVRPMAEVVAPYVDAHRTTLDRVLDAITPTGDGGPDACTEPGATCRGEDGIEATGSSMPDGLPLEWEGPLAGGAGTYTIEMDEDGTRAVVGGEAITPADGWPGWDEATQGGSAFSFERSPQAPGGPLDEIIVGMVPPDAVETFVVDRNGDPVDAPSLTFSPDGRFYAIHGLDIPDAGPYVWPLRHRLASGEVIPGFG